MAFTVWKTDELNSNERLISFYKKELRSSHIVEKAKQQKHYNTKRYRKNVSFNFPWFKRYQRIKAIVWGNYKKIKKKYNILAKLWKLV